MSVAFLLRASAGEPLLGLPRLIPLPVDASGLDTVPIKTAAMVTGLVTMWAVSRITQDACPPVALGASHGRHTTG